MKYDLATPILLTLPEATAAQDNVQVNACGAITARIDNLYITFTPFEACQ